MLVDTHAHLYWESYNLDFDAVVQRAIEKNIGLIINIGTDPETSRLAVNLESKKLKFYATVGLHPHDIDRYNSDESIHQLMESLEKLYRGNLKKVIGIGECGLDHYFHPDHLPKDPEELKHSQKILFQTQALLAKKLNLPLIIHCREAWQDIFIPELNGTTGLFHNFTGSEHDASTALELGYYLSISCIITYPKNQPLRDLVKKLPLDKLLTETDCPFLPPQPIRGQRNEPSFIPEVIKVIAEVKGISEVSVEKQVYQNTLNLFKLA